MTPYVRDHTSKTTNSWLIKNMLAKNLEKDNIGIDMSILIVCSIKNKKLLNVLNRYHCSPMLPLPSATDMLVQKVGKSKRKRKMRKGKNLLKPNIPLSTSPWDSSKSMTSWHTSGTDTSRPHAPSGFRLCRYSSNDTAKTPSFITHKY